MRATLMPDEPWRERAAHKKKIYDERENRMSDELAIRPTVDMSFEGVDFFSTPEALKHAFQIGTMFAKSGLVPKDLTPEACVVCISMAREMRVSALMLMQNVFFVHGTAGWKTPWIIARANTSGAFANNINWRSTGEGDELSVTAYVERTDGQEASSTVDMRMAKIEEWGKGTRKYQSMPEHMLEFRAAAFLIRKHCPQVLFGMYTREELESIPEDELRVISTTAKITAADLPKAKLTDAPILADPPEPDLPLVGSPLEVSKRRLRDLIRAVSGTDEEFKKLREIAFDHLLSKDDMETSTTAYTAKDYDELAEWVKDHGAGALKISAASAVDFADLDEAIDNNGAIPQAVGDWCSNVFSVDAEVRDGKVRSDKMSQTQVYEAAEWVHDTDWPTGAQTESGEGGACTA